MSEEAKTEANKEATVSYLAHRRERDTARLVRAVDRAEIRMMLIDWAVPLQIGGLSMVEVRHERVRTPLDRIEWCYEGDKKTSVDAVKERIARKIERDARNLPNASQSYVIEAFYAGNDFPTTFERASCYWVEEDEGSTLGNVPNDTRGDRMILHKQCKELGDTLVKVTKHLTTMALKREANSDQRETAMFSRLDALQTKCESMFEAFQNALDRTQEREQKAKNSAELIKGAKQILETAQLHAPALINAYVGRNVLPVPEYANPIVEKFLNLYGAVMNDAASFNTLMFALKKNKVAFKAFGLLMTHIEDFRNLSKERAKIAAAAEAEDESEKAAEAKVEEEELAAEVAAAEAEDEPPRRTTTRTSASSSPTKPKPYVGPFGPLY